jgi:hypothetical protein
MEYDVNKQRYLTHREEEQKKVSDKDYAMGLMIFFSVGMVISILALVFEALFWAANKEIFEYFAIGLFWLVLLSFFMTSQVIKNIYLALQWVIYYFSKLAHVIAKVYTVLASIFVVLYWGGPYFNFQIKIPENYAVIIVVTIFASFGLIPVFGLLARKNR